MNLLMYINRDSLLHRMQASKKLLLLCVFGSLIFLFDNLIVLTISLIIIGFLYKIANIPIKYVMLQLKPLLLFSILIFIFQFWFSGYFIAITVVTRIFVLVLLALLVTFTTKMSAMVATIENALMPFQRFGVSPQKVSLAISLAIRLIPLIIAVGKQVQEAQKTRGLDKSFLAVIVPTIIQSLKMADNIADAIDARSFD